MKSQKKNKAPHPSGFPYGRSEASPAGEQMERTGATLRQRHSASMEEIQDNPPRSRGGKRVAFTLAEVLITLGIIGIVAAMTIPTLFTKVQDQIFKTRWKKAYSELNQAFKLLYSDDDIDVDSYFGCQGDHCIKPLVDAIFAKYKVVTKIKETAGSTRVPDDIIFSYKSINGKQWSNPNVVHWGQDVNGMTFYSWTYVHADWYGNAKAAIWVDVNGYRNKPNVLGRDMFALQLADFKMEPAVWNNYAPCNLNKANNFKSKEAISNDYYVGVGCSAKYIYEK